MNWITIDIQILQLTPTVDLVKTATYNNYESRISPSVCSLQASPWLGTCISHLSLISHLISISSPKKISHQFFLFEYFAPTE